MRTTVFKIKLDGRTFRGRVPYSVSNESPVPPWAMLLVSKMAEERSKGRAVMRTWLTELADEEGRPTELDLDVA